MEHVCLTYDVSSAELKGHHPKSPLSSPSKAHHKSALSPEKVRQDAVAQAQKSPRSQARDSLYSLVGGSQSAATPALVAAPSRKSRSEEHILKLLEELRSDAFLWAKFQVRVCTFFFLP